LPHVKIKLLTYQFLVLVQLKDTMTLLDAKEKELKQKTIELANLQHMSHKYHKLKNDHQSLSKEWRERKNAEQQWRQTYQQSQARYQITPISLQFFSNPISNL
jgi:predicted metalloprotease